MIYWKRCVIDECRLSNISKKSTSNFGIDVCGICNPHCHNIIFTHLFCCWINNKAFVDAWIRVNETCNCTSVRKIWNVFTQWKTIVKVSYQFSKTLDCFSIAINIFFVCTNSFIFSEAFWRHINAWNADIT